MRLSTFLTVLMAWTFATLPAQAADLDARGFAQTAGGAGGKIIRVTNLNNSGPGSLREAIETEGPRIIVFEVGGVIDLNRKTLTIVRPYVTIAGQTAPPPGITIIRGSTQVVTHDVIVQHIRFRPGDAGAAKGTWQPDGLTTNGPDAHDILIDHCSFSWGVDEALSVSGPRVPGGTSHHVTLSNNLIAETLANSTHPKRVNHSRATVVNDFCENVAIVGNIYAHNDRRHPDIKPSTTGVFVNNLVYNAGVRCMEAHGGGSNEVNKLPLATPRWAAVGNVFIPGADNKVKGFLQNDLDPKLPPMEMHMEDNRVLAEQQIPLTFGGNVKMLPQPPVWPEGLKAMAASDVPEYLLARAGARRSDRDPVDERIVRDIRSRTGRIIDSQDQVGGYPKLEPTRRPLEIPAANVEAWLAKLSQEVEQAQ